MGLNVSSQQAPAQMEVHPAPSKMPSDDFVEELYKKWDDKGDVE